MNDKQVFLQVKKNMNYFPKFLEDFLKESVELCKIKSKTVLEPG